MLALVNEGTKILAEGIAARPVDIDMVWVFGYGFPQERGGPMHYADVRGTEWAQRRIAQFAQRSYGWAWNPELWSHAASTDASELAGEGV